MSKLIYTTPIDETFVSRDELNTRFADVTAKVNVNKFDVDQFRNKTIRYRHFERAPVRFLWEEVEGTLIIALGVLTKVGAWNVTNVSIDNVTHTAGYDPGVGGVAAVYAEYEAIDWEPCAYEIGIGYRHSGTWYIIPGTERTLGDNHTIDDGVAYIPPGTTHYYTGAANWRPTGAQQQPVITTCSVITTGHLFAPAVHTLANIDRYALMIRVNNGAHQGGTKDVNLWDKARIWAIIKDST